ncbi:hypothetical protein D3C71_1369460 [compost metagenome]
MGRRAAADALLQEQHRVLVMGDEIEILRQLEVVRLVKEAHEVMGKKMPGTYLAQNIGLPLLELYDQAGAEAFPVQKKRRIMAVRRRQRDGNLREAGVGLAPEHRPPCLVQRFNRAVPFLQPPLKLPPAVVAVAQIAVAVAQLIVDLPARDMGVVPVAQRHHAHEIFNMLPVRRMRLAIMMPPAEAHPSSLRIHRVQIGMQFHHPDRRCCCRRAQHRLDPPLSQQGDGFIQPAEFIHSRLRLHLRPGEFRHPHDLDAQLPHHVRILLPQPGRAVLGVIINAKSHGLASLLPLRA